ncbi:glycosyltransferase family 8 protein, partial [Piedraia hortae CBS 480.64]
EDVYCTLVLSDAYLPGAAVLAHSLRDVGTQKKLVCLITPDSLQHSTIVALQSVYDYVIPVDRQSTPRPANLYVMNRPDLLFTFTKLNLWKLVQFRKIVYIDADVVALRAPDELFDTPEAFAAVSDVGWPDIFNTGVMVITPNMGEYHALQAMASAGDSFDGADQGLLNQYYEHRPWKRLSFGYNCTPSANYQYEPAYRYYKSSISLAHFIGLVKPWQASKDTAQGSAYAELLSRWWAVYDRHLSEYPVDQRSEAAQGEQRMQLATATPGDYKDRCEPCTESQEHYSTQEALQQPAEQLKTPAVAESAPKPPANPPSSDWNATLTAPSPGSQPEAANLDIETYVFSEDPGLFQPPADCSVSRSSKTATEKPPWMSPPRTPIFPWEERADAVVPQRRFSEAVSEPLSKADSEGEYSDSDFAGADELEVQCDDKPRGSKRRGAPERQGLDTSLGQVNSNAWDGIEGIDAYVRDLTIRQRRRLHRQQTLTRANQPRGPELIEAVNRRRESLKVTDFPTESERPSLPVTPAPRHRQPYWGVDRDPMEDLPPAEGVPHQSEWV